MYPNIMAAGTCSIRSLDSLQRVISRLGIGHWAETPHLKMLHVTRITVKTSSKNGINK